MGVRRLTLAEHKACLAMADIRLGAGVPRADVARHLARYLVANNASWNSDRALRRARAFVTSVLDGTVRRTTETA